MSEISGCVAAHTGLDDIGIDRALDKEIDLADLLRLGLEDADELLADDLALPFRFCDAPLLYIIIVLIYKGIQT